MASYANQSDLRLLAANTPEEAILNADTENRFADANVGMLRSELARTTDPRARATLEAELAQVTGGDVVPRDNGFIDFAARAAGNAPTPRRAAQTGQFIDFASIADQVAVPQPKNAQPKSGFMASLAQGGKIAFEQWPQLGYGLAAIGAAGLESMVGEGGLATALKQGAVRKYQEWGARIAADSTENYEWDKAYDKAKGGDLGALADFLGYGIGYGLGQGAQLLATAGVGGAVAKTVGREAVEKLASGMVAKEAAQLAAGKEITEAVMKQAVSNVASKIGTNAAIGAYAIGMEGGEIGGDLAEKSVKEGRVLTGSELVKALGATTLAAGFEFAGDKLGLGALTGKLGVGKEMTGLGGRALRGVTGAMAAAPGEFATEYMQTGAEEYGKGNEANILPWNQSEESQRQAINAGALGAVGGGTHGVIGGLASSPRATIRDIGAATTVDEAIAAADAVVSASPALGYQAGAPLVVFPDGTTMTRAEAQQRFSAEELQRLDAMVQDNPLPGMMERAQEQAADIERATRIRAERARLEEMRQRVLAQQSALNEEEGTLTQPAPVQPTIPAVMPKAPKGSRQVAAEAKAQEALQQELNAPLQQASQRAPEVILRQNAVTRASQQAEAKLQQLEDQEAEALIRGKPVSEYSDSDLAGMAVQKTLPVSLRQVAAVELQNRIAQQEAKNAATDLDEASRQEAGSFDTGSRGDAAALSGVEGGSGTVAAAPARGGSQNLALGNAGAGRGTVDAAKFAQVAPQAGQAIPEETRPSARSRLTPLQDERIAGHADDLRAMAPDAGWAERGGLLLRDADGNANSRTKWIPRAEWFMAGMMGEPKAVQAAVEKAIAGQPMTAKEKRTVQGMMDWLDHKQSGTETEYAQEMSDAYEESGYDGFGTVGQEVIDTLGDFDFDAPGAAQDAAEAMRALGFTEDEINDYTRGKSSGPEGSNAEDQAASQERTEESRDGRVQDRPSQDGFALESPSEADLRAREEELARREAELAQREKAAEEKHLADLERDTFGLTGSDRPTDVQTAQGQGGLFTADGNAAQGASQSEPAVPSKIEDFGEKIGGAKKDLWGQFRDKLERAKEVDIAAEPLSKSWPEPDYQKLLDAGSDPWSVAFMRSTRDEIPRKPSASWKLKNWVSQVATLRDFTQNVMDDTMTRDEVRNIIAQQRWGRDILGRIALYQAVGHTKSLHGVTLQEHYYSLYKGEENVHKWVVEKEAKATLFSNWPRELAVGDSKDEAIAEFKRKFDSTEIDKPSRKEATFEIYSRRGEDGYWIGKKIGRNPIFIAGPFATVKEARAYKEGHQSDLIEKLEKAKEIPNVRRDSNNPRVGEDMRGDQDVTPKMFSEAFGFKGVEFGNWVEQKKRQKDLNETFDALMDMAAILNVPPRALSLNGELGLAFGARGTGGIDAAVAHYERDYVVINLTKKEGAGSLGHEWWHALDNYFSRMRGKGADMMTEALDVSLAARSSEFIANTIVRKEMISAFGRVMEAIKLTAMRERSANLDNKRSKAYWTTKPEMTARAFESYLISKLQDQNASNDYLANIVDEHTWKVAEALGFELDGSYPYPTAGEVPVIRAAFDHFFDTLETEETDKGIRLHSITAHPVRQVSGMEKLRRDYVQGVAEKFQQEFKGAAALDIRVVFSREDIPERYRPSPYAEGVYHDRDGVIHLVARNLPTKLRTWQVLMHETVGHYGLASLMGEKFSDLWEDVLKRASTGVELDHDPGPGEKGYETVEAVRRLYPEASDAEVAQEVLARMAETMPPVTWFKLALSRIRNWMRSIAEALGLKMQLSLNDARDLVMLAAQHLREGGNLQTEAVGQDLAFASRANAGMESRAAIIGESNRHGGYTPEQLDFFRRTGRTVEQPTLAERIQSIWKDAGKKLAQGIVDQFQPLRELGGHAYTLARLSKGSAGAFEAMLHHGKLSLRDGAYDADTSGGVVDRLGIPLHGEMEDFMWWVAANRAERLTAEDREHLFTPADIAAGKSLDQGVADFDYTLQHGPRAGQATRDRTLIYRDALKTFDEFNRNAMDMAEQSGLIDGASRQYWEHEFYVPFYRVSDEDGEFVGAKMGNALVRQQAFKQLKGGTDKLNSDLLANTLRNWAHLIDAAAKNRAAKASLEAAETMGVARRAVPGDKKTVWFMNGGQKQEYKVDDPYVLTAITSLEYAGMRGPLMDILSSFKHWLTIGVTASPAFKVRNLIRDSLQAIGTSDLSYSPFQNIAEGWKATDRASQDYVSALASGGLIRFGTMLEGKESDRVRQLVKAGVKDSTILDSEGKIRAFYDRYLEPAIAAYNELGNRGEEINRAALYKQLVAKGVDHAEASLLARDLMDFSMQGSWNTIRFLTQVVPFMNARLQGLYKLSRAAKEDPAKFATVLGATAMFSIVLMLAYSDDDDWKKREDFDRDNFWWFKLGGTAFRIPKPFEIGALATLAERSLELVTSDEMTGERFAKRIKALLADNLSLNPVPQAIKPIIDIYANKDSFTGRPIETMGMERLEPEYRYSSNTSMVSRGLSTATLGALSPMQYDHLIRSYFSWLGSFVVGGADLAIRPATNEPTKPTLDYWKLATQGFVRELPEPGSRYVSQMYDQAKVLEGAYGTYHDLIKRGRVEEAQEYAQQNADKLQRYRNVESVKRAEAKLNERIRMVERSNIDPDEKKAIINAIQQQKDRMARAVAPGYSQQ